MTRMGKRNPLAAIASIFLQLGLKLQLGPQDTDGDGGDNGDGGNGGDDDNSNLALRIPIARSWSGGSFFSCSDLHQELKHWWI